MENQDASDLQPLAGGSPRDAARARAAALVGRTLRDRYRIEELVAMGGLAAVFRATRLAGGHEVAIKILHPEVEGLPELIDRFEREALAGKHILHPNVVAVHEIDRLEDGSWFLVQDYVRGRTLRELIAEGPVAPVRAARIARQVALGLLAAHDMRIVHRDLKPLNIMISHEPAPDSGLSPDAQGGAAGAEEVAQIVDFGLAKVPVDDLHVGDGQDRHTPTQDGVLFGTLAYLAPEAALGMQRVDWRADLYALGVILYEMLAGARPFTATDPAALFAAQRTEAPPPIAVRSPGVRVPAGLEAVVRRLLEKDPDARYPSTRALLVALDAAIAEAEGGPGASRGRGWIAWVAIAAVVVAVVVTALFVR